jgi:hypothetical protein
MCLKEIRSESVDQIYVTEIWGASDALL